MPRHVEEMQAEQWAHEKMREAGVPIPPKQTQRAKLYVARKIYQAKRRGAKNIDPRAREFAGEAVNGILGWYWVEGSCYADVPRGRYQLGELEDCIIDKVFGGQTRHAIIVTWIPKRGKPEQVGVASTWRKAGRMARVDHKYRNGG